MINYELRPRGLLVVVHGCKCIYYIPRAPELDAQRVHEELERPLGRRLQGVWAPRPGERGSPSNQYCMLIPFYWPARFTNRALRRRNLAMSSPGCSSPFTLRSWLAAGPYTLVMSSSFFGSPYHAGLLAALLEAGLPPSAVAGSSSGALVASLHAAGLSMEEEYLGVLRRLAQSGVLRLACPWEEPGGLFSLR